MIFLLLLALTLPARAERCGPEVASWRQPGAVSTDIAAYVREYRRLGAGLLRIEEKWKAGGSMSVARIEAQFEVQDEMQKPFDTLGGYLRGWLMDSPQKLEPAERATIQLALKAYDRLSMRRPVLRPPLDQN